MASISRSAQEKLAALEKAAAPFEEQLVEAFNFIGGGPEEDRSLEKRRRIYYGREEWLLRWLLKKLQSPKDHVPRKTPASWRLLRNLLPAIPVPNAAQVLSERKFMTIVQQTLEEAFAAAQSTAASTDENADKISKKRRRSGEIKHESTGQGALLDLASAIYSAMDFIISSTEGALGEAEGRSVAFTTEYMKSVVRTTSESSSSILGTWVKICLKLPIRGEQVEPKLSLTPFIRIWELHIAGPVDLTLFSTICAGAIMSLLQKSERFAILGSWTRELEQLIARNIIIPSKVAYREGDSSLLGALTNPLVSQDVSCAPVLFNVTLRSLQNQGARRRRPQDDTWLQAVFASFKESIGSDETEAHLLSVSKMLQSALENKVDLGLPVLRALTSELAIPDEKETDWVLVATLLKLDSNVFLIPNEDKDLLQGLLVRITRAPLDKSSWLELSDMIVGSVVVPLINEFSKARDLSGFMRHWYAQLLTIEGDLVANRSSAWVDTALVDELRKLMEASLTVNQISQILDWLAMEVNEHPSAVSVLLDAMVGAISQEEVIDTVGLRPYHIMFDGGSAAKMSERNEERPWSILLQSVRWLMPSSLEEIACLWEQGVEPFKTLVGYKHVAMKDGVFAFPDPGHIPGSDIQQLLCACAMWSAADTGSKIENLARQPLLARLRGLAADLKGWIEHLHGVEGEWSSSRSFVQSGRYAYSCMSSFLVHFPKVLDLGHHQLEEGVFRNMLQDIFWLASTIKPDVDYLGMQHQTFSGLWSSVLHNDFILNNSAVMSQIMDVMLSNMTQVDNPLIKSKACNAFAVQSLAQLPIEVFNKRDRERIMQGWSQETMTHSPADFTSVLSLQVRMMHRPTIYKGLRFEDMDCLERLTKKVGYEEMPNQALNLRLVNELVQLTLSHVTSNLDQAQNRAYIQDALSYFKTRFQKIHEKAEKPEKNLPFISATAGLLGVLMTKSGALEAQDIIGSLELKAICAAFQTLCLSQLQKRLEKKFKSGEIGSSKDGSLAVSILLEILGPMDILPAQVAELANAAEVYVSKTKKGTPQVQDIAQKIECFTSVGVADGPEQLKLVGLAATTSGRQSIRKQTLASTVGASDSDKFTLLAAILGRNSAGLSLEHLLAARHIISECENKRQSEDDASVNSTNLSTIYSDLCSLLRKASGVRQFCLVSEIMLMMLRTKNHALSQWNIDSTLGSISIICSRQGPNLRPSRAGTIYLHICALLKTILTTHRLKMQGRFHLVVQSMQALLHCLYTPLAHSTKPKHFSPPPWLPPSPILSARHAAAYTRLILLICDPTVSSVTRSSHNSLTSATDKAKRTAGQHMVFLLTSYIRWQLEMRMWPEVRKELVQGIYAIFECTTPEGRRAVNDGLDSGGRAVFAGLYKDYMRFGKWKGA